MSYRFLDLPCYSQNSILESNVEAEIAEAMSYLRVKRQTIRNTLPVYQAINNLIINAVHRARPVNIHRLEYNDCQQLQYDTIQGVSDSMANTWAGNTCGSTIRFFPNYYCIDVEYVYDREGKATLAVDADSCKYSAIISILPRAEEMRKWPNVILDNVEVITRELRNTFFPGEAWRTASNAGPDGASITYDKDISTDALNGIIYDTTINSHNVKLRLSVNLQIPHSKVSDKISESCGLKRIVKTEERVMYKFSCEGDNE